MKRGHTHLKRLTLVIGFLAAHAYSQPASVIEEIVVTAQKREQGLNEVPISISATPGDELAQRQITNVDDLIILMPDLTSTGAYGEIIQNMFSIRGLGPANQFNFNVQQPVGTYMDEIYQFFVAAPSQQMFDLERVEMLKGPQGTLYGRNTTGGAINFITRDPDPGSPDINGFADLSAGSFDQYSVSAASDIPIGNESLGARIALRWSDKNGFMENVGTVGPDNFGGGEHTQGRVTILYDGGGSFQGKLKVYHNDFEGEQDGMIGFGVLPGNTNVGGFSRDGFGDFETALNFARRNVSDSTQAGLTLSWFLGHITIASITTIYDGATDVSNDCEGTPTDLCRSNFDMTGDQVSQEIRIQYESGRWDVVGGASYSEDEFQQKLNVAFGPTAFFGSEYRQEHETYGFYFDSTYSATEALRSHWVCAGPTTK